MIHVQIQTYDSLKFLVFWIAISFWSGKTHVVLRYCPVGYSQLSCRKCDSHTKSCITIIYAESDKSLKLQNHFSEIIQLIDWIWHVTKVSSFTNWNLKQIKKKISILFFLGSKKILKVTYICSGFNNEVYPFGIIH